MCTFTSIYMYMHASVHALAFLQSPGTNVAQESNELHHTHKLQHNNPVVSIYIYAALPQSYVGHVYRWLGMASHIRKLGLVPHVLHNSTWPKCMAGSVLRLRILMKRICRFEIVININWFQCGFLAKGKIGHKIYCRLRILIKSCCGLWILIKIYNFSSGVKIASC